MPTVQELATELGVDLGTINPAFVARVGSLVTEADARHKTATELEATAQENLRKVQTEQDEINSYIAQYGQSEEARVALEANLAAYKAVVENVKAQGINVEVPTLKTVTAPSGQPTRPAFDPEKFTGNVSSVITQSFNLNNKHLALYGRPLPDDIDSLAAKAKAAGKSLFDFGSEKYDFAGEEKRKADAASAAHDAEIAAKAVKDYQEKNPNTAGNPFTNGGGESRYPQILKPRDPKDQQTFANLNPRQKLAASVARSREAIAANQA